MKKLTHTIEPIYDTNSKILILGSFPSVISRENNFYYANPNNRFWPVLSRVYDEPIHDRKQFCLKHYIALWDVIYSCTIKGSDDSSIQNVTVNDIEGLLQKTKIQVIFTTGKKAEQLFQKYIHVSYPQIGLPSTSSANARFSFEDLVQYYKILRDYDE